ncbi:MAG TPA: YtxH domain-containing protein [Cyclobacteriaceae bacterium]
MKTGKAILVIAGAASAGLLIGTLIAREKGSTLRRSIKKSIKEQSENFVCELGDILEKAVARFDGMKNTISNQLSGLEISREKIKYN